MGIASKLSASTPAIERPEGSLPALRRGFNLTHWFEYERGQAVAPAELRTLRDLGLDHVRLPVDPVVGGWRPDRGGGLAFLPALRDAVEQAVDAGLEVVVDLHMTASSKQWIEGHAEGEAQLGALWRQLARAFADLPAAKLAFELYNEPQYYGPFAARRWPAVQQRLLDAVRSAAPHHLVLLSGNAGGSFAGLRSLPLTPDPAVAYVFHYYEPFLFTHQGAEWQDLRYTTAGLYRDLRYPATQAANRPPRLTQPHARAARELADYIDQDWGAARVRADFDAAGSYARRTGTRVVCNEFGVIRAHAEPASRYRWIADVRRAAEANDLGWTLWDYTDIFGITHESAQLGRLGARSIEPEALTALALRPTHAVR